MEQPTEEIAATVAEEAWKDLKVPVRRVTAHDTVVPLARLESAYIPSTSRIVGAVCEVISSSRA
jgi:pyruvate/2-oxoglutarate/acetoin dehydrogenase E1 component